jgi:hypothetical protein
LHSETAIRHSLYNEIGLSNSLRAHWASFSYSMHKIERSTHVIGYVELDVGTPCVYSVDRKKRDVGIIA